MRNSLSNLQYLMFALLLFALTGCGANSNTLPSSAGTGKVTANLVYQDGTAKSSAKTVAAAVPTGVATIRLKVTGAGIPNVKQDFPAASGGGSVQVYPGSSLIVSAQALDASSNLMYEGFAVNVTVASGVTTDVGTIVLTQPTIKATDAPCILCHDTTRDKTGSNIIADYKQSGHYTNNTWTNNQKFGSMYPGCAGCHGTQHNDPSPAANGRCFECHGAVLPDSHLGNSVLITAKNCDSCHKPHNTKQFLAGTCLACHTVAQNANNSTSSYVNDNNGVRAITAEFSKNSHHVTGKVLTDADCAVCHLEGNAGGAVNTSYHMRDNKIHLRNGNTSLAGNQSAANGAEYIWDPANPNHTAMDQFCMSCHNSGGAPAAVGIVAGNSATNPFADAISNGYDQMSRSVVTPVFDQFDTGNSSHHAVRGQKYSGRTRATTANPAVFTQYSGAAVNPTMESVVLNGNAGIGPMSPGSRHTIYEAGYFVSNYTPLGAAATVADDSTLHCGDCHTVGQFKPGSTTGVTANTDGTTTVTNGLAAIGAHGSNNEYMLRTSDGTDVLHHQTTVAATGITSGAAMGGNYVCFLCHKQNVYGAEEVLPFAANQASLGTYSTSKGRKGVTTTATGTGGHGGMHPCNDDVNAESTGLVGSARVAIFGYGEYGGGNLFGYTCAHCHNAGNKGFGGIHGGNAAWGTYSSTGGYAMAANALGYPVNSAVSTVYRKTYRFMGGLSNRYNGGATAAKWESQVLQKSNREGCYNFAVNNKYSKAPTATTPAVLANPLTAAQNEWVADTGINSSANNSEFNDGANGSQTYGTWGACSHHNGSATAGAGNNASRKVQRPLKY